MLARLVRLGSALALLAATSAPAQNLVDNGDFAEDLAGWDNVDGSKTWSDFDETADPSSGSLRIWHLGNPGTTYFVEQCIPVDPSTALVLGFTHVTFAELTTGQAEIRISEYKNALCLTTGTFLDVVASDVEGTWTRIEYAFETGAETESLLLRVGARKDTGQLEDEYRVFFDDIELPEPGPSASLSAVAVLVAVARGRARR